MSLTFNVCNSNWPGPGGDFLCDRPKDHTGQHNRGGVKWSDLSPPRRESPIPDPATSGGMISHYAGGPLPCRCDECLDSQPKLRYDLIPEPALAAMAHAFTVGTKHGDGIKVESFATEYAAIMRHLEACRRGETVDPDDGHLHLGAVMARCAKLIATGTKWEGE